MVPWRWRPAWELCLDQISQMVLHITYIYCEGNQVADSLASRAPSIDSSTWWNSTHSFVSYLVNNDVIGKSNFRFC